jgi:hypothetical protein
MPKIIDNIVVNSSVGAFIDVTVSMPCRKVIVEEDPNNGAAAGLQYKLPDDGFVAIKKLEVGGQLNLGNSVGQGKGEGPVVGFPAQSSGGTAIAATVVAKLLSVGAATKYRRTEVE